jgi:hypothetical protein
MIRYYLHRPNKPILPLIHIRETLQIREKLRYREPTGYSLLSSVMIRNGREVIGCIVLRLTRSNLPHLLYLCMGQLEKSSPLSQSQGILLPEGRTWANKDVCQRGSVVEIVLPTRQREPERLWGDAWGWPPELWHLCGSGGFSGVIVCRPKGIVSLGTLMIDI